MRAPLQSDSSQSIDRHVGLRLAERRRSLGYSQAQLARAIGVTFQQVQKYERGVNRLSAPRLWDAADFLNTDVNYYFEGLETEGAERPTPRLRAGPDGAEIAALAETLSSRNRKLVLDLIRQLSAPMSAPTELAPS